MHINETKSGIVVASFTEKKEETVQNTPARYYANHELLAKEAREKARKALLDLWDAMGLSSPGGFYVRIEDRKLAGLRPRGAGPRR